MNFVTKFEISSDIKLNFNQIFDKFKIKKNHFKISKIVENNYVIYKYFSC